MPRRPEHPEGPQPIRMETCDDYSDDEAEFLREVEAFKKRFRRRFVSLVEGIRIWEVRKGMSAVTETLKHIRRVQELLGILATDLIRRAAVHDSSKLESPEAEVFEEFTAKLKASTYGSDEYKGFLAAMKPALDHHYAANSHHPEHYPRGIKGMSLLDVIEMLADWKAATERHADGNLAKSIELNQQRFGYGDELKEILKNTASACGWLKS